MVESVGKKLNQARLKRGLTIDEAAHATRLRPDKITALENDDYSRFANNIYGKGFLQIYARFLDVDVTEFSRTLDNANPISVSDYQYLSNAPTPRQETTPVRREERRPPSLAPLFFFLAVIALGGGFLAYRTFQMNAQRLETHDSESPAPEQAATGVAAATPEPATPVPAPAFRGPPQIATATPAPAPTPAPVAPIPAPRLQAPSATPAQVPAPVAVQNTPPKTSDQDFVTPTAVQTPDPTTHPLPPSGVNEVLVATVKTTWVTVRKDDPKARPIFEDYVYPNANPLKLKGARFFIEARDPTAVQITKNGLPYAYQAADVPVQ